MRSKYGNKFNTPKSVIVHSMGEYIMDDNVYSAEDFLHKIKLSAHILVHPSGAITRMREDNQGAYHAKGFNTDSLGIEFLVQGTHDYSTFLSAIKTDYMTPQQYRTGVIIVSNWISKYGIKTISRHSDISPNRKFDPGSGFNWEYFIKQVRNHHE